MTDENTQPEPTNEEETETKGKEVVAQVTKSPGIEMPPHAPSMEALRKENEARKMANQPIMDQLIKLRQERIKFGNTGKGGGSNLDEDIEALEQRKV